MDHLHGKTVIVTGGAVMGEADDIAWAAVYLASDEAKFVTGAELVVDGGYTAR
ncbi:Enoyl-(Acyl carrier protein) reductase [[Luteovulum] sphaeroides subsp. megalophilum]|uniref:SDR family oxidoreductase n=1 Tax=Cereibacter sphaeroides TaxID=1063 RepID=UPI000B7690CD|nr:SDR family oxidoreductase [Cereibacter sphaeroides]SNT42421.1 Enoyl-(Acyl carrier protein) reductase [[Luteovulum] sphaeroides subsp. megalophilum]